MTTIPPHPGLSGLAAREATTPADITLAADDDADRTRSDFTGAHLDRLAAIARRHGLYAAPVPCGCCGPQLCCCDCHKRGFLETPLRLMAPEGNGGIGG